MIIAKVNVHARFINGTGSRLVIDRGTIYAVESTGVIGFYSKEGFSSLLFIRIDQINHISKRIVKSPDGNIRKGAISIGVNEAVTSVDGSFTAFEFLLKMDVSDYFKLINLLDVSRID